MPIFTYSLRLYNNNNIKLLQNYLINLSIRYETIRYSFFWELIVQLKERQYRNLYNNILNSFLKVISSTKNGKKYIEQLYDGIFLVKCTRDISKNGRNNIDQYSVNVFDKNNLYAKKIHAPFNPKNIIKEIYFHKFKKINSSTTPLLVRYLSNDNIESSFLYKNEDLRVEQVIIKIIKLMNIILVENDLDMNIITYNIIPTSLNDGFIEFIDK